MERGVFVNEKEDKLKGFANVTSHDQFVCFTIYLDASRGSNR